MKTRVREEREKQGYSATEFAELVGISRQALFNIEKEKNTSIPSLLTALKISQILHVDVNDLWDLGALEEDKKSK